MTLILDTGPIFAALDSGDPDHLPCANLIMSATEDLIVPGLVLAEVDYFCHQRLGVEAWLIFLDDVITGVYRVEHPTAPDLSRCHELQSMYTDLDLGVVDASVVSLAERLGETKVATLDHRHFSAVRPNHTPALELLPR